MKFRIFIRLLRFVGALGLAYILGCASYVWNHVCKPIVGRVVVKNECNCKIVNGTLKVGRNVYPIDPLNQHARETIAFEVQGDTDYKLTAVLLDGRTIESTSGYITTGVVYNDVLIVKENEVILDVSKRPL